MIEANQTQLLSKFGENWSIGLGATTENVQFSQLYFEQL